MTNIFVKLLFGFFLFLLIIIIGAYCYFGINFWELDKPVSKNQVLQYAKDNNFNTEFILQKHYKMIQDYGLPHLKIYNKNDIQIKIHNCFAKLPYYIFDEIERVKTNDSFLDNTDSLNMELKLLENSTYITKTKLNSNKITIVFYYPLYIRTLYYRKMIPFIEFANNNKNKYNIILVNIDSIQ